LKIESVAQLAVFARSDSDEAIHSCLRGGTDCFASLAMTPSENAREKVNVFPTSLRGAMATKQSILACAAPWIASLTLAMTGLSRLFEN